MSSQRKRHQRPHLPAEIEQYEEETYPRGLGIVELAVAAVACILVLLAAGYYLAQGGSGAALINAVVGGLDLLVGIWGSAIIIRAVAEREWPGLAAGAMIVLAAVLLPLLLVSGRLLQVLG